MYDITYQSMVLTSVLHSDLGLVASKHARQLFPTELRAKVRVQSEAFVTHPRPVDVRALREQLGLPAEGALIGFFGRSLEAVRGFDIFLQVARQLRQARPDLQFLVIGAEQTRYGNELTYLNGVSFKQYALNKAEMKVTDILWRELLPYDQFIDHLACRTWPSTQFEGPELEPTQWQPACHPVIPSIVCAGSREGRERRILFDPYVVIP
jgi:glycosyltransferase involved in cell wall biosynthesis